MPGLKAAAAGRRSTAGASPAGRSARSCAAMWRCGRERFPRKRPARRSASWKRCENLGRPAQQNGGFVAKAIWTAHQDRQREVTGQSVSDRVELVDRQHIIKHKRNKERKN